MIRYFLESWKWTLMSLEISENGKELMFRIYWLCCWYFPKQFMNIFLYFSHSNPLWLSISLCYSCRNWVSEKLNNLAQITISSRTWIQDVFFLFLYFSFSFFFSCKQLKLFKLNTSVLSTVQKLPVGHLLYVRMVLVYREDDDNLIMEGADLSNFRNEWNV